VTSFWNRAYQAISPILEGRNNDLFFTELGFGLHFILLEHFKKFVVNAAGGLILTKSPPLTASQELNAYSRDIALYHNTIESWRIPSLAEPFELLREIGNVFIVKYSRYPRLIVNSRPDILRSLLREGVLGRVQPSLIGPYLKQREDYNSSNLFRLVQALLRRDLFLSWMREGLYRVRQIPHRQGPALD